MKRFYLPKLIMLTALLCGLSGHLQAQTLTFSQTFTIGATATAQCTAWHTYAATLLASYNYTSVTIYGSQDPIGHTTTDPVVTAAIAAALRTGASYGPVTSGGYSWEVNSTGGDGLEITNTGSIGNCNNPGYSIRPCITNLNWGGIDGPTCDGATQTMSLTFHYQALLFTATSPQSLSVCENSAATSINSLLSTTYPTTGLTETWSVNAVPAHGSLGGFPVTGTTTSGTLTPTGSLTYTPAAGYSGIDSFKIQASDGTSTAIMGVTVTINPTPASVTGISCVVLGQTSSLSDASSGGVWSSGNATVASITSSGVVTGSISGTAIISYLVGAICPATVTVSVNTTPGAISGAGSVCTGAITTLSDPGGGTWSSSSTSAATVDGSGNVTGVSVGGTIITYTLPTTCIATQSITVNSAPGAIAGTASVCQGLTTTLTDVVSGGTWSSSAGTIAVIAGSGGTSVVTGSSTNFGTSNIIYTLPTGCTAGKVFTVNQLPTTFIVSTSGTPTYCAGTSNTASILLVGSSSGVNYQLYNGLIPSGSFVTGTGSPLNFGVPSSPGTYTIVGTNVATGCVKTMLSSAIIAPKPLPAQFVVTGGGPICTGESVADSLSGSATGVSYKLILGGTDTVETIGGTGSLLSFGLQAAAGTYTVVAYTGGTPNCSVNMISSASIVINSLPDVYDITGGGTYCAGTDGVPIGLQYSEPGISYQLYNGGDTVGLPITGTGDSISFGLIAVPGSGYQVVATSIATSCQNNMAGIASVNMALPPNMYDVVVAGDPTGCAGSAFPVIGLDNSDPGVNYQLYNGLVPVGSSVPGAPGAFNFGIFTDSGTYTVVATDQTYFCVSTMNGSEVIDLSPLPDLYNVTGGGSYCALGAGVPVMLDGSQIGITYTLSNSSWDTSLSGTGSALNFGNLFTGGTYTISASSDSGCTANMTGSALITINPLPLSYNVIGSGNYCAGGTGIDIGLDFSTPGIGYQLYAGPFTVGAPISGTGDSLNFGYHTPAGTYSIVGENPATGCSSNMSGNATIIVNPLPGLHTVNGGGSYCSGAIGMPVNINGSDPGIRYQLYNGFTAIDSPVAGTGAAINFGLQTLGGTYTVVATDTTTQCARNMSGAATIVVNVTPGQYTVTGGGIYCQGASGVAIGLSGSNSGVHYLLYNGALLERTVTGTGATITFGLEADTGAYTVVATNIATGCTSNMIGNAVVATNTLPTVYSVIGGGSYCSGSSPVPSVGLGGSDAGVNYQLYNGTSAMGTIVGGTGAPLDFGTQPTAGIYTVVATNAATGCVKNMSGSASVVLNPLPSIYTVTGGGSYCAGGPGSHVYMSISNTGIEYILYQGATTIDTIAGTGAGVDFGLQTTAGSYTAVAFNPATGCINNMTGSATIAVNSLPATHTITAADDGNYCVTASGVAVGLDGSNTGINYQLYKGLVPVGTPIAGTTGGALTFGIQSAGNYSVIATNGITGCKNNMAGIATVNAVPLPDVYAVTGGGNYCTTGLGLHIGLSNSDSGTQYQLYHGASPLGSPVTGVRGAIDFGMFTGAGSYTIVAGNGGLLACNANMSGAAVISVYPVILPAVSVSTPGGDTACAGVMSHFSAIPVNGGTAPVYTWSVNGVVTTATGSSYNYMPANGDMVKVIVHSDAVCAIPDTASRTIMMTVSIPEAPSVTIAASPGDKACQGAPVTFTGTPMFGGSTPSYTWVKNSIYIIGTGPTLTYAPANNDIVVLLMGSSFQCRLLDSVFSNTITMEIDAPVNPTVTVYAVPGTQIAVDQSVTLTASVVNGSATPTYQWLINGVPVSGATNASFTSTHFTNNDSVVCEVGGGCSTTGSNYVIMHVGAEGVQQIIANGSANITLVPNPNNGIFTIKGTLETTTDEEVSIEVVNMLGQVVYSNKVMAQNGNINERIQTGSSLANGMYILNLRSGSLNTVLHFVIEQ